MHIWRENLIKKKKKEKKEIPIKSLTNNWFWHWEIWEQYLKVNYSSINTLNNKLKKYCLHLSKAMNDRLDFALFSQCRKYLYK